MIHGINPFTISKITWTRFRRVGDHPSWSKLMKKRHPIAAFFGLYSDGLFDGFYWPSVKIYGSGRDVLKIINCKSNAAAEQLHDELNKQLADWVECKRMHYECGSTDS